MNPVEAIRRGPHWPSWPSAWKRGLAYGMITRGPKGVSQVFTNIATMQKRLDVAMKQRVRIATKPGDPNWRP